MRDHRTISARRPAARLAALAAMTLVLAACSSTSSPSEAPGSEAPGSEAPASEAPGSEAPASEAPGSEAPSGTTVTLSGSAFSVPEITIPVGSLAFVNDDGTTHILAEGENGTEVAAPRVQKVSINGGAQGELLFTAAGDYNITCLIHGSMHMVVHVQ
jgi:plastocyanin